jgi:hypothetical protein
MRAEQAAEEVGVSRETGGKRSSEAKALTDFVGIMRGLKPQPPYVLSFSAACEAPPTQSAQDPET